MHNRVQSIHSMKAFLETSAARRALRRRARSDGRRRAGDVVLDFIEPQVRRAHLHHDHRVGPRLPEREHADREPRGPFRARAALSTARARGSSRAAGVRVLPGAAADFADPAAIKRLQAMEEFEELGSGYRLAMRDLEIRGAGNVLGVEQHGHVAAIGFELYTKHAQGDGRPAARRGARPRRRRVASRRPYSCYHPRSLRPRRRRAHADLQDESPA